MSASSSLGSQRCEVCSKEFDNGAALVKHVLNIHNAKLKRMSHSETVHEFLAKARQQYNTKTSKTGDIPTMTELERGYVDKSSSTNLKFRCQERDKEFSKTSALRHFCGRGHELLQPVVSEWVVVSDGNCVKKKRFHKLKLESALVEYDRLASNDQDTKVIADDVPAKSEDLKLAAALPEQGPPLLTEGDSPMRETCQASSSSASAAASSVTPSTVPSNPTAVVKHQRQRPRYLTVGDKQWIRTQSLADIGDPAVHVGSVDYFKSLLERGIKENALTADHTSVCMRSYMRTYRSDLQDFVAKQERCRLRRVKRQQKKHDAALRESQSQSATEPSEGLGKRFRAPTREGVTAMLESCVGRTRSLPYDPEEFELTDAIVLDD